MYVGIHINSSTTFDSFSLKTLKDLSEKHGIETHAYCYMPDHLHLLLVLASDTANLIKFIKTYKQITGCFYKEQYQQPLWQKSYSDHILRREENIIHVIYYILGNPIRNKLAENFYNYPYSDSLNLR